MAFQFGGSFSCMLKIGCHCSIIMRCCLFMSKMKSPVDGSLIEAVGVPFYLLRCLKSWRSDAGSEPLSLFLNSSMLALRRPAVTLIANDFNLLAHFRRSSTDVVPCVGLLWYVLAMLVRKSKSSGIDFYIVEWVVIRVWKSFSGRI